MNFNLTIRRKMMIFIVGVTVLIYIISLGYISFQLRANAIDEAQKLADSYAQQKANEIKAILDEDMAVARSMADIIKDYTSMKRPLRDTLRKKLMVNILKQYPKYDATWMSWQLWAIEDGYDKPYGRERKNYYMRDGKLNSSGELANLDGDPTSGVYWFLKYNRDHSEKLSEPYWYLDYDYSSGATDSLLGISPTVSIEVDGKFVGVIGTDMTVDDFKGVTEVDYYDNGFAFLLSNQGVIISHKNESLFSQSMDTLSIVKKSPYNVRERIKNGDSFSYQVYDEDLGEQVYVSFAAIPIGRSSFPWSTGFVVPVSEITAQFNAVFMVTLIVGLAGLIVLVIITYKISAAIAQSLEKSSFLLTKLAEGDLSAENRLNIQSRDELGVLAAAANELMDDLIRKAEFSHLIGKGNLDTEFASSGKNDMLGISLLRMRENLRTVSRETREVIQNAGENGELMTARMKTDWEDGAWKELSDSVNNLLDSISLPFNKINTMVDAMAAGDLTVRYDEEAKGDVQIMASSFNKALDNINELIENIAGMATIVNESSVEMRTVSEEMTYNTREIASSISEMSNGAQNQVVKVDESSGLVEGILRSSNEMGEQAENINEAAQGGVENSEKGQSLVKKVGFSMRDIAAFSSDTHDSIQVLTRRSNEISRALGVITEIASQTNLLALNAAIEAAQAGDAGRGFAVVAEEIRKLAEDSKKSAREIEQLVNDVQNDVSTAASAIEMMKASVKSGEDATNFASEAFNEITSSSNHTLLMSEEIRKRVKQQIESIKNVVTITESVVVIAEETAAGTEQVASSATELSAGMESYVQKSQSLSDVAAELIERVSKFRLRG